MKRTVIKIDEKLCNGCGKCVQGCHEGALQLVNGKAVMISDLYCDGLGACIGECPVGAIEFEEREAEPYSEEAVMKRIVPKGEPVIIAHLNHLKNHGEIGLFREGLEYLKRNNISIPSLQGSNPSPSPCACAGSHPVEPTVSYAASTSVSELRQFPVQLHLLNPVAPFLYKSNLLLAADCTAFASGNFHAKYLKGRSLAIACPKLDSRIESYVEKLAAMIDDSYIDTLTVLIMEVPCCGGLLKIAKMAREKAVRNIPIKSIVLSIKGEELSEEWI